MKETYGEPYGWPSPPTMVFVLSQVAPCQPETNSEILQGFLQANMTYVNMAMTGPILCQALPFELLAFLVLLAHDESVFACGSSIQLQAVFV